MRIKVLRKTKILLICFAFILSSCQVTKTGEEKTSTLNDIENKEISKKKQKVELKENLEDEPKSQKQQKKETDNISSIQKTKDNKRILDFFADLFGSESEEQADLDKHEVSKEKEIIKLKKPELVKKKQINIEENKTPELVQKKQIIVKDNKNTTLYKPEKPKDEKTRLQQHSTEKRKENQRKGKYL